MKKVKLILMVLLFTVLALNISCKREGCIDPDAVNYDEKAKKDDGSCIYKTGLVIWWDKSFSESWYYNEGCEIVKVYFDGTFIDSKSITTYWSSKPNCSGGINKQFDLGKSKTKIVKVKLIFEGEDEYGPWTYEEEETLTLNAKDECLIYQWTY